MAADFILNAGIRFKPRDIDTKAIRTAVTNAVARAKVRIAKIHVDVGSIQKQLNAVAKGVKLTMDTSNFKVDTAVIQKEVQKAIDFAAQNQKLRIAVDQKFIEQQIRQSINNIVTKGGRLKPAEVEKELAALQKVVAQLDVAKGKLREIDKANFTSKLKQQLATIVNGLSPENLGSQRAIASVKKLQKEILGSSSTIQAKVLPSVERLVKRFGEGKVNVSRITKEADRLAKKLQEAKLPAIRREGIDKGVENLRRGAEILEAYNQRVSPAEKSTRQFNAILAQGSLNAQGFGAKIGQVTTRFAAYLVSIRALFAVQQAFNKSLQVIVQFDDVLQDLQKVLNETPEGLKRVSDAVFDIATSTGRSFRDVGESLNNFVRQGISTEEALKRTREALVAMNVTGLDAAQATKFLTASVRVFKEEIKSGTEATDILVETADNAATTADQVGIAFLRTASSAEAAGVSFRELNAIIAATIEQTQLGGAQIGTALKTIFTRIISNADALRENANALGANIVPGQDVVGVLRELAAIFPELNKEQKNQLALLVGGRRQANIFIGAVESLGKTEELLQKQFNSAGNAARKNEIELSKLSAQSRQLAANTAELIANLAGITQGAEGAGALRTSFSDILGLLNNIVGGANSLVESIKELGGSLNIVSSILGGIGKTVFFATAGVLIRGIISGLRQFLQVGKQIRDIFASIGRQQQGIIKNVNAQNSAVVRGLQLAKDRLTLTRQIALEEEKIKRTVLSTIKGKVAQAGKRVAGAFSTADDAGRGRAIAGLATTIVVGLGVLSDTLRDSAASARETGEAGLIASAGLKDAGASALSIGTTVGLLAGPIAGAVAGLGGFIFSLTQAQLSLIKSTKEVLRFVEAEAKGIVDADTAFEKGGQLLRDIVLESGNREIQATDAFNRALERLTSSLDGAVDEVGTVFDNVSDELARSIRTAEIQKAIADFTRELRTQDVELDLKIEAGGIGGGAFAEFSKTFSEVLSTAESLTGELGDQGDIFGRMLDSQEILNELQLNSTANVKDLLVEYGLVDKELQALIDGQKVAVAQAENLDRVIGTLESEAGVLVKGAQEYAAALEKQKAELDGSAESIDGFQQAQQKLTQLQKEAAEAEKQLNIIKSARLKIDSKLLDFESQIEVKSKERLGVLQAQATATEKIVSSAALIAKQQALAALQTRLQIQNMEEQNSLAIQHARERSKGLTDEIALNQARERQELRVLQRTREITRERDAILQKLRQQLEAARSTPGTGAEVARIQTAINQVTAGFSAKLNAELAKLEAEGTLELEVLAEEQIKSARKELLAVELDRINQLVEAEKSASNARIEEIRRLSQVSGGRELLEKEVRGIGDSIVRFFGETQAAVLREQGRAFASRLAQIKRQEEQILDAQIEPGERLQKLQSLRADAITAIEERNTAVRSAILGRLEQASKKVKDAEATLVAERNKIPALTQKIIAAERALQTAQEAVRDATTELFSALQSSADAQIAYQFAVANARTQIQLSTGDLVGYGEQIKAVNRLADQAFDGIRGSEEKILEIRSQIAQQALSIFQNEFNAIKSIGLKAATASAEEFLKLQEGAAIAAQIIAENSAAGFSDEQLALANALSDAVPGLERLISEEGLRKLGVDAEVLNKLEDRMLELAEITADSSKQQVVSSQQQVQAAKDNVRAARQQVEQQKDQLKIAQEQRELQFQQIAAQQTQTISARAGFNRLQVDGVKRLRELVNVQTIIQHGNSFLSNIDSNIKTLVDQLKVTARSGDSGITIANNASGSLSGAEVRGLMRSASREKRAMPPGSQLMLANTSEVVLTRNQARDLGLRPMKKDHAQGGNAAPIAGLDQFAAAINNLVNKTNATGLIHQYITIRLDQEKTVNVRGVEAVNQSIRQLFEQEMQKVPERAEFNAIANLVVSVIDKLREEGTINVLGE